MQQIFFCCLPAHRNSAMNCRDFPLLLGRVCSKWRQIAYTTPRLWSSIHVVIPSSETHANEAAVRLRVFEEWIDRTGSCPLHISIRAIYSNEEIAFYARFFKVALDVCTRWDSIELVLPTQVYDQLEELSSSQVPILKSMNCKMLSAVRNFSGLMDDDPIEQQQIPFSFLQPLSSIRTLHLQTNKLPFLPQSLVQLEFVFRSRIFEFRLQEFLTTLSGCPRLEKCTLTVHGPMPQQSDDPVGPITLSRLKYMEMKRRIRSVQSAPIVFQNLILPALEAVTMDIFGDGSRDLTALADLVSRSSCPLNSLTLREGTPFQSLDAIMRCLGRIPELESLTVYAADLHLVDYSPWKFGDQFLSLLIAKPDDDDGAIVLPRLRSLTLYNAVEAYSQTVQTFLFDTSRPLKEIVIRPSLTRSTQMLEGRLSSKDIPQEQNEMQEDLEQLRRRGMQVEIILPRPAPPPRCVPVWFGLPSAPPGEHDYWRNWIAEAIEPEILLT